MSDQPAPVPRAPCGARALAWSLVASCVLVWLGWLWVGTHARPVLDDFAIASVLDERGFLGAQVYWYENWSGKFVALAAMTVYVQLGALQHYVLVPLTTLLAFALACALAARGWRAGALVATVVLANLPGMQEAVYWLAATPYLHGAALVGLTVAALRWEPRTLLGRSVRTVVCFGLPCLAAGTSETLGCAALVAFGLWAVARLLRWNSPPDKRLLLVFLGAGAGVALVLIAPGNAVRLGGFPERELPAALLASFGRGTVAQLRWLLSPSLLGGALLALQALRGRRIGSLGWRAAAAWLTVCLCWLPSQFIAGTKPPVRAQALAFCVFVIAWGGLALPALASHPRLERWLGDGRLAVRIGGLLVALGLLAHGNGLRAWLDLLSGDASAYAAAVDGRLAAIARAKDEGRREVSLPALPARPRLLFVGDFPAEPGAGHANPARWLGLERILVQGAAADQPGRGEPAK
jgi:hypothetical protein